MNRHQVLTGAANDFENCLSIGSVEHNHFTVYGSGGNLVILSSNFERVQIISSCEDNSDLYVKCLDCTMDTGKIAASYGKKLFIFEPTPSAKKSKHNIHYKWVKIGLIELESDIECISWNNEGRKILIACSSGSIEIWSYNSELIENSGCLNNNKLNKDVKFTIQDESFLYQNNVSANIRTDESYNIKNIFKKVWHKKLMNPVKYLKYSPDGSLFASFCENDRLVKIWHEINLNLPQNKINDEEFEEIDYDYIYLTHPRAVISLSWRQISKYMPKGIVSNSLITCCKDNICRIWTETILPDESLNYNLLQNQQVLNINQSNDQEFQSTVLNSQTNNSFLSNEKANRQKKKLFNKLQKMRLYSHFPHFVAKTTSISESQENFNHIDTNKIPSSISSIDVNSLPNLKNNTFLANFNSNNPINVKTNGFHFHLAGYIDPSAANIPIHLLPNLNAKLGKEKKNFVVNWLQNKDFYFSYSAEIFTEDIQKKLKLLEESCNKIKIEEKKLSHNESTHHNVKIFNNTNSNIGKDFNNDSLLNSDDETKSILFGESIDHKLDQMLKDWYSNHDVLFSIHPLDGSILIWLVDWLDDYITANSYKQVQISFHAKLPNTIPIGDSTTLTNNIHLFIEHSNTDIFFKNYLDLNMNGSYISSFQPDILNLVSKHNNGSLNLWRLHFQENSKYQSLVNLKHLKRICGHRLNVNDIISHPVLPFLLSNSTSNVEFKKDIIKLKLRYDANDEKQMFNRIDESINSEMDLANKFKKELIIWGVEPIGPLSVTGGIYELARIDSLKSNAFKNIAWFPCFLPSFSLGNISTSPSTLFASSEISKITIYQAVFDARSILHEFQHATNYSETNKEKSETFASSTLSYGDSKITQIPNNSFKIVSIQSTARPGCIIELEKFTDSEIENWSKADLFHIFHKNIVSSEKENDNNCSFQETYYLIFLEKRKSITKGKYSEFIHMWKITICSNSIADSCKKENFNFEENNSKNRLIIKSTKVCQHELFLPDNVFVVCATPAADDLSSSAFYYSKKVPYLFSTACSDGTIRFWSCKAKENQNKEQNFKNDFSKNFYEFFEWELNNFYENVSSSNSTSLKSKVFIGNNFPLAISCSYNGRFAVAYKIKKIKESCNNDVMYCVKIFECESTGGSEWKLEDIIQLKNIELREIDSGIDFKYIFGNQQPIRPSRSTNSFKNFFFVSNTNTTSTNSNQSNINQTTFAYSSTTDGSDNEASITPEIPSTIAKLSIKRQFSSNENFQNSLIIDKKKNNVEKGLENSYIKLDWASNENGSHLLTIGIGNKIHIYSSVSNFKKYKDEKKELEIINFDLSTEEINSLDESLVKWFEIRSFELDSADDQPALPSQIKWVREGILIIGLNSEMQIYSQWSTSSIINSKSINNEHKEGVSKEVPIFDEISIEKKVINYFDLSSLFMHAKNKMPILPQYHPKQLLELMNSGKINCVKSILIHLTICLINNEFRLTSKYPSNTLERKLIKRKISIKCEKKNDEQNLNYLELENVPPLPLFQFFSDHSLNHQNKHELNNESQFLNLQDDSMLENLNNFNEKNYTDFILENDKKADSDDFLKMDELKKKLLNETKINSNEFNSNVLKILIEYLQTVQIKNLSSIDQIYLIAIADTVVNLKCELNFNKNDFESNIICQNETINSNNKIVDDCGFKFLLSLQSYNYMIRILPNHMRESLKLKGLGTANFAWAFHSECEQELLKQILSSFDSNNNNDSPSGKILWADVRQFGIGWWLKTPSLIKPTIEKIAKSSFQLKNDPLDSALYYLAMRKKGVLLALFKSVKDTKMTDFFKNNFEDPKWQTAALKNAFVLLGKQRFEHAAAFFLLAGKIKDAIEVCLRNLKDIQLAFILTRLYFETSTEQMNLLINDILSNEIFGENIATKNLNETSNKMLINEICFDPFLRSMSYWMIKNYTQALDTLYDIKFLKNNTNQTSIVFSSYSNIEHSMDTIISNVFNFYSFLKKHPYVIRQRQNNESEIKEKLNLNCILNLSEIRNNESLLSFRERKLHFLTAYYHFINGCPLLSLDVLSKIQNDSDIFSQQLKFISCLKIFIEELTYMSNGLESSINILRYYLYFWLEKVSNLINKFCGNNIYNNLELLPIIEDSILETNEKKDQSQSNLSLLHEEVLNDQKIFKNKVIRINKRKIWLKKNESLIRTFLSYCNLYATNNPGLNSVKMELLLLMQELIEDRSIAIKQLHKPIPIQTTTSIPLISASISSSNNILSSPIKMLKNLSDDILTTLSFFNKIPNIYDDSIYLIAIEEASLSLSSCIYQCLCDGDIFQNEVYNLNNKNDEKADYQKFVDELNRRILYKNANSNSDKLIKRKLSNSKINEIESEPKNWPGISTILKFMDRCEEDQEVPKLKILLYESLISIYSSLLLNALVFYESQILYIMLKKKWDRNMWNKLFGGASKKEFRYKYSNKIANLDNESSRQRLKINSRLGHKLNPFSSNQIYNNQNLNNLQTNSNENDEKVYLRDVFVSPETSIVKFFLNSLDDIGYFEDFGDEKDRDLDHDENYINNDEDLEKELESDNENDNPNSFSWNIIRFSILKYSLNRIIELSNLIGFEINEISIISPVIHQIIKSYEKWIEITNTEIKETYKNQFPENYFNNKLKQNFSHQIGSKFLDEKFLTNPSNTPFLRLWNLLSYKKEFQEIIQSFRFEENTLIRKSSDLVNKSDNYLNQQNESHSQILDFSQNFENICFNQSIQVIYKDQEPIISFCYNENDKNYFALSNSKEIIEININNFNFNKNLFEKDEIKINYKNDYQKTIASESFINSFPKVTIKRNLREIKKLASHPSLPYYISGSSEGVIKLWHYGSVEPLSTLKQIDKSAKISKILFNPFGNKFGVSDNDGFLNLYQLLGCTFKQYINLRCHKSINDFLFVDSSSILLTIGAFNDSFVVSLWDTLMPTHKSLIKSFKESDVTSGSCVAYSSTNHYAYCANKKGEIFIYELRMLKRIHKFSAHESSVKAISIDPDELYLSTGSSEGNVKIWNLKNFELKHLFQSEHSKTSIIRNFNSGVNQLEFLNNNSIVSCGADGTLLIRNFE